MLSFPSIPSATEPPKKKRKIRASATKFQGKWHTNLGILYVNGSRGYYGHNLTNCLSGEKFLTNISANSEGNRVRGTWKWALNDSTFGKCEFILRPDGRSFTGTWGWNRRWKGGGLWNGSRFHSMLTIKKPVMNVTPAVRGSILNSQLMGLYSGNKAVPTNAQRKGATVYTSTSAAVCKAGGGIKIIRSDSRSQKIESEQAPSIFVAEIPKIHSIFVAQSLKEMPKKQEEAKFAVSKPNQVSSVQELKKLNAGSSSEASLTPIRAQQSAVSMAAVTPISKRCNRLPYTLEEPQLAPSRQHSPQKLENFWHQSQRNMLQDRRRSNGNACAKALKRENRTVTVKNSGRNVKSAVRDRAVNSKIDIGLYRGENAALDYVRRMTARVKYTFTPMASCDQVEGIQTHSTDPISQNLENERTSPVSIAEMLKDDSQYVAQSPKHKATNQEEVIAYKTETDKSPSFQKAEEPTLVSSNAGTSVVIVPEHQSETSVIAVDPVQSVVPANLTQEPELKPDRKHEVAKVENQSQSSRFKDICRLHQSTLTRPLNKENTCSTVKNPMMNVEPAVKVDALSTQVELGARSSNNDNVPRMTARVKYDSTKTTLSETGGGNKTHHIDPFVQSVEHEREPPVCAAKLPNDKSLVEPQSLKEKHDNQQNQEEANVCIPETDKLSSAKWVEDSPKGTSVASIATHQSATRAVAVEPSFEYFGMPIDILTDEPELEPELEHSTYELGDQQSQSQLTILGDGCPSFEPTLVTSVSREKVVIPDMNKHVNSLKPRANIDSNDHIPVNKDNESEDSEDMPNLSMSNTTSLFSMP